MKSPAFILTFQGEIISKHLLEPLAGSKTTKIDEVQEQDDLLNHANDIYSHYSSDEQKLNCFDFYVIQKLIIFDEPTSDLDPAGPEEVRDLIPQLAHESGGLSLQSPTSRGRACLR